MPPQRSFLVLTNTAAGSRRDGGAASAIAVLREAGQVETVTLDRPGDVQRAVAGAAGREVVVVGGDGTLHACVNAVVDADLQGDVGPIGLVPLGTGNDFARALGIPLDPVAAAHVVLGGEVRSLDLLRDDGGGLVVNAVHAGVGAEATRYAQDIKGLLGAAGYALGAVRAGVSTSGWNLRVEVDGEVLQDGSDRTLMVTVTVGSSIGGGAPVAPEADASDELAEVIVSSATGPLDRAGYALAMRRGSHARRRDVVVTRGREVRVAAVDERNAFRVNADGDVGEPRLAATWTVLPRVWRCRTPGGAGPAQPGR